MKVYLVAKSKSGKSVIVSDKQPFISRTITVGSGEKAKVLEVKTRERKLRIGVINTTDSAIDAEKIYGMLKPGEVFETNMEFSGVYIIDQNPESPTFGQPTSAEWVQ